MVIGCRRGRSEPDWHLPQQKTRCARVICYLLVVTGRKTAADQSSPRLRPGKHCRPLQQHSMFRQNVQNSQNRFSSKAFGLSESILLILLILSEFATSRCLRARRPSLHSTMKKFLSVSLLSVLIAFGLQAAPESKIAKNPPPVQSSGAKSGEATSKPATDENAKPIDPSNMDPSVKPVDDFFFYANGGWIKRTEIPPEYSRWGSFNQLIEHNNDALHVIAEKAAKTKADPKTAPEMQKVGY